MIKYKDIQKRKHLCLKSCAMVYFLGQSDLPIDRLKSRFLKKAHPELPQQIMLLKKHEIIALIKMAHYTRRVIGFVIFMHLKLTHSPYFIKLKLLVPTNKI